MDSTSSSIRGAYSKQESERNQYLFRARDCALFTIPTLVPPAAKGASVKFTTPYQGVGARGVNNIASKLLIALFPPTQTFFRLNVEDDTLEKLGASRGAAEDALSIIEQRVVHEVNSSTIRVQLFEALKQLVVAGNVLLYLPPKTTSLRVFRLDRYVVSRDPMGNVVRIITKEDVSMHVLDMKIREELNLDLESSDKDEAVEVDLDDTNVCIYTMVQLNDSGSWDLVQEIDGKIVESTRTTYPADKSPWMALRLISVDSEDYGRSYVEEYMGDLQSLEGLTKAIVESAAAASKLLIFVSPNGTTRKRNVAEAPNLAILEGNAADVTMLRTDKQGDFRVAMEAAQQITERLSYAFMLNSAVQRKGDRVTAEEIRYMASELENVLGGIYSVLAQELQLPLVTILMSRMQRQGKIPALPKDMVHPTITTGMEGLGRSADLQKLDELLQSLSVLGQEAVTQYLNVDEYIKRRAAALQIDTKGLIKTQEEVQVAQQKAQQQAAMQQAMQAAVPGAVKGGMDMMANRQQANIAQEPASQENAEVPTAQQ
jgi:hypothetical protein